jgi:hypothetical protein
MGDKNVNYVFGNARPGQQDEFNEWYGNVHLPEVLAMPGVVSAQRFDLLAPGFAQDFPAAHRYLAV